MFSQTAMTNRRNFLERSMWGFGSAFLLPSLLTGCTDHLISPTGSPVEPPPVSDSDIDWNDDAKALVAAGIGTIPVAGGVLAALLRILWPSTQQDIWAQIKAQVEALINQKISDLVYQQVSDDLGGLQKVLVLYLDELEAYNDSVTEYQKDPTKPKPDPTDLRSQWIATRTVFAQALPHFQSKGYESLLLPLFAQFVNMYLSVLRDAVLDGKSWGRSDAEQQQDITDLKQAISDFTSYTDVTYTNDLINLDNATPLDPILCEPDRSLIRYTRQMTFTVLDFATTWAYYDVTVYPSGHKVEFTREIFSDPIGVNSTGRRIIFPSTFPSTPEQFPTQITVWANSVVTATSAVQVTYPAGGGPGGVTTTPIMPPGGDQRGSLYPPHGGTVTFPPAATNPIVKFGVGIHPSGAVAALYFYYYDGTHSPELGYPGVDSGRIGFTNEALCRVHINGAYEIIVPNYYTRIADCVVFGFKHWQTPASALRAIGTLYITSPKERSAAEFAPVLPALASFSITDELKAARAAHWASIKEQAKALK
ncbi:insecticidal delta-endotoxin Cry8Ea1 family protein [Spirosoma validum]|uniref:Pesticidal crystal protein domain-containing protein n=1 Tax=Spirosoma validum TaxID=2771355 RepID=A0A927B7J7_9BACT|nr:insecticidal delta-endotoxin Cry8Ea1 family protein [Spirosoma validum]MBD2757160.1 hypothetical protein [Spirosoma validum]